VAVARQDMAPPADSVEPAARPEAAGRKDDRRAVGWERKRAADRDRDNQETRQCSRAGERRKVEGRKLESRKAEEPRNRRLEEVDMDIPVASDLEVL
jgi:hypothetical protein